MNNKVLPGLINQDADNSLSPKKSPNDADNLKIKVSGSKIKKSSRRKDNMSQEPPRQNNN